MFRRKPAPRGSFPDVAMPFPAFETWSTEQQESARKLNLELFQSARPVAMKLLHDEIERLPQNAEVHLGAIESAAARNGIALIDSGKWRLPPAQTHALTNYVRMILEMFARGDIALPKSPEEPSIF